MAACLWSGLLGLHLPAPPPTLHLPAPPPTPARIARSSRIAMSADAHAAVADWCAAAGRDEAAVTVLDAAQTPEVMRDFWYIARAIGEGGAGGQRVVAFPGWTDVADIRRFQKVINHISTCSEACEYLGESIMCSGRHPQQDVIADEPAPPYPLVLLRSFAPRAPAEDDPWLISGDEDDLPWFFNDDDDDYDPVAEKEGLDGSGGAAAAAPPASDEDVIAETEKWVDAVVVHMKVCPFSQTVHKAGLPIGGVTYPLCRATTAEELYQAFWQEVENLGRTDEKTLATVLLVAPDFGSAERFDAFTDTLNDALTTLGLEEQMQLVFFHPQYTFRDGQERMGGEGSAANFARRSPYPMVNLLRTPQVRAAQKGVPTGSVYTTNEENLATVGCAQLEQMLAERKWDELLSRKFTPHNVNVVKGV